MEQNVTGDKSRERFEEYWRAEGYRLLREDDEYRRLVDSYKVKSGGDIMLFAIPVVVGVAFMELAPIERELLRWIACAAVVVVAFVLCVWAKSAFGGGGSADEVERRVKERCYAKFKEEAEAQAQAPSPVSPNGGEAPVRE